MIDDEVYVRYVRRPNDAPLCTGTHTVRTYVHQHSHKCEPLPEWAEYVRRDTTQNRDTECPASGTYVEQRVRIRMCAHNTIH